MRQNIKDEQTLRDLESNSPVKFPMGKRMVKMHRLCNETSIKVFEKIQKLELDKMDKPEDIINLSPRSRRLIPQVISLVWLKSTWKIKLFHWALWRILSHRYSQFDFMEPIGVIIKNSDLAPFSNALTSLRMAAKTEIEMTKVDISNIAAKQKSGQETT